MYFYKKTPITEEIEAKTDKKIKEFLNIIKKDKKLQKYILSLGIVGPAARKQNFYFNSKVMSDIDFYVISTRISPPSERYLRKTFRKTFKDMKLCSLLIASPTIFKRPDLMFFEYTNTGKVLYGRRLKPISINKISRFECFRNIAYRGCYFLNYYKEKKKDTVKFLYYYSKIIFAVGEILLILTKQYKANNFERNNLIKKNKPAKKLKGFIKEHQKMHDFRYNNKIPKGFLFSKYNNKALIYLKQGYDIISNELFNQRFVKAKEFKRIHPNILSSIVNKFFFTLNYYQNTKKVRIHLIREPFIELNILFYKAITTLDNKDIREALNYWKSAGWFYYKL